MPAARALTGPSRAGCARARRVGRAGEQRTLAAQVAASFVNLMAPSSLGGAALNARYLERSGIDPALAVATVGVTQVAALVVHLAVLLVFGVMLTATR